MFFVSDMKGRRCGKPIMSFLPRCVCACTCTCMCVSCIILFIDQFSASIVMFLAFLVQRASRHLLHIRHTAACVNVASVMEYGQHNPMRLFGYLAHLVLGHTWTNPQMIFPLKCNAVHYSMLYLETCFPVVRSADSAFNQIVMSSSYITLFHSIPLIFGAVQVHTPPEPVSGLTQLYAS